MFSPLCGKELSSKRIRQERQGLCPCRSVHKRATFIGTPSTATVNVIALMAFIPLGTRRAQLTVTVAVGRRATVIMARPAFLPVVATIISSATVTIAFPAAASSATAVAVVAVVMAVAAVALISQLPVTRRRLVIPFFNESHRAYAYESEQGQDNHCLLHFTSCLFNIQQNILTANIWLNRPITTFF